MAKLALFFVLGAWALQQCASLPNLAWVALLLPLFCLSFYLAKKNSLLFKPSLAVAAFTVGLFWAAIFAQIRMSDALPKAWERQSIQLVGVVATMPQQQERGMRFEFDVERVLTPDAIVPKHISLSEYTQSFGEAGAEARDALLKSSYKAGERWRLTVRLKRPHGTLNPHGFDFESWALERNIRAGGYVRQDVGNQRLAKFVWRPSYLVEAARERIAERMRHVLGDRPYAGVLRALAIGDDDAISLNDWQVFLRTGVTHLISISGLHITMLSGMFYALVYALWRRSEVLTLRLPARKAATVAGVLVALSYALVAGFSVPTQRTLYMLAVFAVALWVRRNLAISQVLAYALFVVVLLDPWATLSAGFWLSFGAVAILAYGLGGRLHKPHWLRDGVRTQWAITIGSLPILIALFGQVSIISPVANAIAIPVISLLVVPTTLLGALLPFDWALILSHSIMAYCMQCLIWLSNLPIASWQQQAPPVWAIITATFGVAWVLLPRGFPLRWIGYAGLLPMFLIEPPPLAHGAMKVAVIDVGQGLATVVRTRNHQLLYDAGPTYSTQADAGNRIIVPYLRGEGIARLSAFMVSHNDNDHSGGMASVLKEVPVGWLLSSLPEDSEVLQPFQHKRCMAGQRWQWDGVRFEVLHPSLESYDNESVTDNNRSCVLKVMSQFGSLLLTGDIERQAEAELLDVALDKLRSDVLIAPHHGSKTSSTMGFVEVVNPSVVIFTMGYLNRFNHPKQKIVERYEAINAQAYRSDRDGAVLLDYTKQKTISIKRWRAEQKRYWHDDDSVNAVAKTSATR